MDRVEFEELVVEALDGLPGKFKEKLENIEVVIEGEPPREVLREQRINPPHMLLGLYRGVPLRKRGTHYSNVLPDKITLFQTPIESICRTQKEIKEKVREVVMHEIGHYFGLKEEELR